MPDKRAHRGPAPQDLTAFAPDKQPALARATAQLSWLFERGYAENASLKLVGDRYKLTARQRTAVRRCACPEAAAADRQRRSSPAEAMAGAPLEIDGFNVLTSIEAALSGGVLILGRDGCLRDMASMHGSYRRVAETVDAINHIGAYLEELGVGACRWYFDAPVSNSGRLKALIAAEIEERGWEWDLVIVPDPDPVLAVSEAVVASADSGIIDRCPRWFNLVAELVARRLPEARVLDLSAGEA